MNIVNIMWDDEAKVYIAICDTLGISLEAETYDELLQKVIEAAPEMAELKSVECSNLIFSTISRQYNYV